MKDAVRREGAADRLPAAIRRSLPGPRDVQLGILFCGVYHSHLRSATSGTAPCRPSVRACRTTKSSAARSLLAAT